MGIYWLRSNMRKLSLATTLFLFALHSGLRGQQTANRHRIAVLDFSSATAGGASQEVFGTQVDFAQAISQMLTARLVSDGTYEVIEGKQIERVLKMRKMPNSGFADPKSAAKFGHSLGVDAVVIGQVTQFGWDDQGGTAEATPAKPDGPKGAAGPPARRAVVAITAQLIDTNTGQSLATANSKGVSKRSGTKLLDTAATSGSGAMDSSGFAQSMIGAATAAAVSQLATELEGENAILPRWTPPPPRGEITSASRPDIVIDVGSAAGLKAGDKMLVTRLVHVEMDRVTETAVGAVEDEVGVLTITSVQENSAVGRFSGTAAPKVGDQVRPLQ